jgi:ABC-2 type transport system ATP-binding protein
VFSIHGADLRRTVTVQANCQAPLERCPALEAIGISKRFGDRDALHDVDFTVACGRVHGLLGPNGAGKTTLIRILLGLVRRDAGRVALLGHALDSIGNRLPDGVGGMVEAAGFYPYLTGRRNLALLARLDGRAGVPLVSDAIERSRLGAFADLHVGTYSAGMRQRLGLAATLLRVPRLLLLDEPTSALDPESARDARAVVRDLAAGGAAVVLSSHDLTEVEDLCDAVTVLRTGRVIFSGPVAELRARSGGVIHVLETSDDRAAHSIASNHAGVHVAAVEGRLEATGTAEAIDGYVIALGRAGIAIRRLERRTSTLEDAFLRLTAAGDGIPGSAS